MILTFSNWKITKPSGTLGYQYDNDSQVLTLGGILPEGVVCVWSPAEYSAYWQEVVE